MLNTQEITKLSKTENPTLGIKKPSPKKGKTYPHLRRARVGNCLVCNKEYRAVSDYKDRKQKYCSLDCKQKAWVKTVRPKMKIPKKLFGIENKSWKGDKVGYSGIHRWIARHLGKAKKCDHCGTQVARKFEWANIDHKYRREINDYMRLCTRCHRRYDLEKFTNLKAIKLS